MHSLREKLTTEELLKIKNAYKYRISPALTVHSNGFGPLKYKGNSDISFSLASGVG